MPRERGGILIPYDQMETTESITPEVLCRDKVRVLIPYNPELACYNAAVIGNTKDVVYIVAREVPLAAHRTGIPDKGDLVVYRSIPEGVKEIRRIDLSIKPEVINWEDPRAFTSGENVLIGLTAIMASGNKPVGATVRGKIIKDDFQIDTRSLTVCLNDEGKNTTPISLDKFLFRRNGFPHSLEVAKTIKDEETGQDKIGVIKTIEFPKKPWCEWQIGTQAQMLPNRILPIHGTNRFSLGINPETGQAIYGYTYSLGLSQLDENMNVIKVSDTPFLTRESFKNILPMGKEMDPNKDVIYCCGYSFDGKTVKFAINIGDLMTVEVEKEFSKLQDMLRATKPIALEELEAD